MLVKTLLNDMLLCAPVITWNLSGFSHGKRTVVWPLAMCRNMAMFGQFSSQSMDSLLNLAVFCTVCTLLPRCFQSSYYQFHENSLHPLPSTPANAARDRVVQRVDSLLCDPRYQWEYILTSKDVFFFLRGI